jgi:hypothetical protein
MPYNKRDLEGSSVAVVPVHEIERDLNPQGQFPSFVASATRGDGVKETFKKICVMTVVGVSSRLLKTKDLRAA